MRVYVVDNGQKYTDHELYFVLGTPDDRLTVLAAIEVTADDVLQSVARFALGAPVGLSFKNGYVNLTASFNLVLEAHVGEPPALTLKCDYIPNAVPEMFLTTAGQWFAGDEDADTKVVLLREMLGVFLLNKATAFQKALFLMGAGPGGKSALVRILQLLMPDYRMLVSVSPEYLYNDYRRGAIAGARFNLVGKDNTPDSGFANLDVLKMLISGEHMTARSIYGTPFIFKPTAGMIFAGSALPTSPDMSRHFWRRFEVLTFNEVFAGDAQQDLAEQIVEAERAELLSWLLEGGAEALKRGHYLSPKSSQEALLKWSSPSV